jgi:carbon starvation protein
MLKKIFWLIVSCIAAYSLAIITGIYNPQEKVNALWLIVAVVCIYSISYRYYAAFLASKVLCLDKSAKTPAIEVNDKNDYVPTNKWVLFGHHFAAIAGAGPLIGPMLAAQFGFLPGFLWILIGATLGGAVHDMVILTASVRRGGKSIAQIAKMELGNIGGVAASIAVLFIIIITLAGLGVAVINALFKNPWGTFTIASTIPISMIMGVVIFKFKNIKAATIFGVLALLSALIFGHALQTAPLGQYFSFSKNNLVIIMAIYGFCASVIPVWLLLSPRGYLSTYMKVGTIFLLSVGVIFMAPTLQMPPVTKFIHGGGPIIPGPLFPFMFITIACGAISGFHAIISSGTTSKMIISEADIPLIGYGAMLTEGFISLMALIAATVLIPGDYFAINTTLSVSQIAALGFPTAHIHQLCNLVQADVIGRPGGAVSLAVGMAFIFDKIPGLKGLIPYWYNFAITFEALFILTTVDTGTRVARFLLQEFLGYVYKPFSSTKWLPGILLTSGIVVFCWSYLIYSGNISSIWPLFGVSNQLLAAIAFGIGTTMILKSGKLKYAWTTFLPMLFMFVTTFTAAYQLFFIFYDKAKAAATAVEATGYKVDVVLVCLVVMLAAIVLASIIYSWFDYFKKQKPIQAEPATDLQVETVKEI